MVDASTPALPTAGAELELDNALWRFVLPFYARDGVSAACLILQDELGVDVNILLFAIFAQVERGVALDDDDLAVLDALVSAWREEIIQPLRRVRIGLKTGPSPAPSATTDAVRNRIKAVELEAEQIELALLSDWLDRRPTRMTTPTTGAKAPLTVARYFSTKSKPSFALEVGTVLEALSQAMRDASSATLPHVSPKAR